MMVGTVPTSVPQFILLGNWLMEGEYKRKWDQVKNNKLFWVLSSLFLIHVIGLLYTSDINAGLDDIRIKMPLMFLPLIFFTSSPLSKKEFHAVLYFFLAGSLINVSWCYIYTFVLHKNETVRSASRFMSHIRLGLYLNVAISSCVYFIFINQKLLLKIIFGLLICVYLFSMYALGLASGIANFFILLFITICYLIYKQNVKMKLVLLTVLIAFLFIIGNYVLSVYNSHVKVNPIPYNSILERNINGRLYSHIDSLGEQKENGNLVMINVQWEELEREWNRRCPDDSFTYVPQRNLKRFDILLRYLTSKTLTKDSAGVWQLTNEDITNIRKNVPNYKASEWSYLHRRLYEIIYEYEELKHRNDINGHSLTMRPYFWKAALHVINNNLIFGVGTGDVQNELNKAYVETNSPLSKNWYKRPHNQFITVTVALGVIGFFILFISLVWPLIYLRRFFHVLYRPFFVLAVLSFMLEDTLESQAGLTFFAFFTALFMAEAYYKKEGILVKTLRNPVD